MINKNKVNIKDTKKILHKVGKKWVVVSVVLLGLVAGGSMVSHMNVNADANQATTQTVQSQNSDQPKTSSNTQSSVVPASSSSASAAEPNSSNSSNANNVPSSMAVPFIASQGANTNSSSNSSADNSDDISNNSTLSLNVNELYNTVKQYRSNHPYGYNDLFGTLRNVPLFDNGVGSTTPTNLIEFLNNINKNMKGYNITNTGLVSLNRNINKILNGISTSLSKNDSLSLDVFLYNLHDDTHIVNDNYNNYPNEPNVIKITPYLSQLKEKMINIAGYNIPNPYPLNNYEINQLSMIVNDVSRVKTNYKSNDNYENIFDILDKYVNSYNKKSNPANILDIISNNLTNILNEANLPKDSFYNTLNSLSVATKSKAASVNSSIASSASNDVSSYSNSLSKESGYASLINSDVNTVSLASSTIKNDMNSLTNDKATNTSSVASLASSAVQDADSKIYSNQMSNAMQNIHDAYSNANSLSASVNNIIEAEDPEYDNFVNPTRGDELTLSKDVGDVQLISDYASNIPNNDDYYYDTFTRNEAQASNASQATSYAVKASNTVNDMESVASHAVSLLNSSIASSTARVADQSITNSYENSVAKSVSDMNSKTAKIAAKSANQSLESSIANSYANFANRSIANSYKNKVDNSVAQANSSKARSAAHKADQSIESSIANSYANLANQSIASYYQHSVTASVAKSNSDRAKSVSQSIQSSIASSDASKKANDNASANLSPIMPSIPGIGPSIAPNTQSISSNVNTDNNSAPSTQISSSATPNATSNDSSVASSKISHSSKSVASTYLRNNDFKRAKKNRAVISTKGFYEYKRNRHGKMKRISFVKPGTKLTVKRVVQNGKLTKLELTDGHVVTANKHLVKLANVKPFKRISTYARALRRANYRVRHNHRLTKFRANRIKKRLVTANQGKIKAQRRFNRRHTLRNHRALNRSVSKLIRIENALLK